MSTLVPEPPEGVSVDLDEALHFAAVLHEFADEDAGPVRFRQWIVEARLGSGGMGTVYLARHHELGRRVALKVINQGHAGDPDTRAARVIREAQALARIRHENVLQIHQVDTSGERAVIEMEYIDGSTLGAWQSAPERDWREIVEAYIGAGEGLAAIHRADLLHRDIKPNNLLRDADGTVKVVDLGLAIIARQGEGERDDEERDPALAENSALALHLTAEGALVGTHGYMAPEVIAGSTYREASDQFSLATSLYEATFGVRPFLGESPEELADAIREGRLAPAPDSRRRPRWLRRALARALRFDPDRRYPSVAAFVGALRRGLRRRRLLGLGFGAALVVFGLPTAVWFGKPAPEDLCADTGAEFGVLWGDAVRSELAQKSTTHASAQTERSLALLVNILDTRAPAWARTQGALCAVQGNRDAIGGTALELELDERQRACLDYARVNTEVLLAQLRSADEDLARLFTDAATTIEALPTCDDRSRLARWPLFVTDDDADEALARALRLEVAGDYPEAEALARRVITSTEVSDPWRHAEALFRLGHVLGLGGRVAPALETLDAARNTAYAIGHDALFCRATTFQAKLAAGVQGDAAAASTKLGLALACAERLGSRSPILRGDLLEARGLLALAAGDPEAAIGWHQQALDLRRSYFGDGHPDTPKSLLNLANAMAEVATTPEQLGELRRLYADALSLRAAELGELHPEVADVCFNLGELLRGQGEVEDAREYLQRALDIYEQAPGAHEPVRAKIHLALAAMDIDEAELPLASEHLERAAELQAGAGEGRLAEVERAGRLALEGTVALRRQDYRLAAASFRRATHLYRRHDPRGPEGFDSLVNEIEADYGLEDFARVVTLVQDEERPLADFVRSLPAKERGLIAWYIGDALLREAAHTEAAVYLRVALDTYEALDDPDSADQLRALLTQAQQTQTVP